MDKVFILICWALMLTHSAAKQQYYPQSRNLTWDEARSYCQICFKDLVTLTPENIRIIVQKLTSDHWIGLRKNFYSTAYYTSNYPINPTSNYPINPTSNYPSNFTSNSTSNYTFSSTINPTTNNPTTIHSTIHNTIHSTINSTINFTINSTSNSSSNASTSTALLWSRWANGDPLTFQNWYPGWPVFKSSFPRRDCCSCSCTCPARPTTTTQSYTRYTESTTLKVTTTQNSTKNVTDLWDSTFTSRTGTDGVTDVTGLWGSNTQDETSFTELSRNTTNNVTEVTGVFESTTPVFTTTTPMTTMLPPIESECLRSPMLFPDVPDPDENYIEDSCVAMLRFGTWVEKYCWELLPFICYEDHFVGETNVTNVTSESAVLTWLSAPGNVSHYRLEVKGDRNMTEDLTDLTYDLFNLTAGAYYSVQVFPVKCQRDLNPQKRAFYTIPNKVENLTVTMVTETSITLSWSKPAGTFYYYTIKGTEGLQIQTTTEGSKLNGLIPGSPYTFSVISVVEDTSQWSEESNITAYTKPRKVSNLSVSENTNNSLLLTWKLSVGNATGFIVKAMKDSDGTLFNEVVNQTKVRVTGLPMGTKITLSVAAVANYTLEGDKVTVVSYTAPGPISNLMLETTENTLTAKWDPPTGNYSTFTITLQLEGKVVDNSTSLTEPKKHFTNLKTGGNYKVIVSAVSGTFQGPPEESSKFTLPLPPTDAKVTFRHKDNLTLEWKPPANSASVSYTVSINSSFWGYTMSGNVFNTTSYVFTGLKSGTKYYLEVKTVVGELLSSAANASATTVTEPREIHLSMMCSSAQSLLCDKASTRKNVFEELKAHFKSLLSDSIIWTLEQVKAET
ncbi:receptor-type tyrosine-protein phosphatase eta [Morone saxatilis]|uniref:receptor-type tyrosine-protein phosphatase eta n=1 Tax=Morone saxatilis TaxID=34816 RepID=UPI0015E20097|nr:receptor-type tyrosine-protein phosphatase eta [Morone saxatilis]